MKKSLKILCLMLSLMLLLCACADKDAGTSSPRKLRTGKCVSRF